MTMTAKIFVIVFFSCIGTSVTAHAVSWSPAQETREEKIAQGIMEKGSIVCLFQSGTEDVRKEIHVDDILTVYREKRGHPLKEVGRIRILSYIGGDYLKGEVIEGDVKSGDIAKKGDVASLVISSDDKCR
jgi:hypothetical protein